MTTTTREPPRAGSSLQVGLRGNHWLLLGAAAMLVLQVAFTYLPAMNALFDTAPIGATAWIQIVAVAAAAFGIVEVEKWVRRRVGGHPR